MKRAGKGSNEENRRGENMEGPLSKLLQNTRKAGGGVRGSDVGQEGGNLHQDSSKCVDLLPHSQENKSSNWDILSPGSLWSGGDLGRNTKTLNITAPVGVMTELS